MGNSPATPPSGGGAGAGAGAAGAGSTPAPSFAAAAPAAGAGATIAIKVQFELDTMDGLRKVLFGLEKDLKGTDDIWYIHFQLQEKQAATDAAFTNVVTLDVLVDDAALHPAAAAAANNGLTPPQAAHALGPAADDAKGTKTGDVDPDDAGQTVKDTLKQ
jgi:hypothetical protein